MGIARRSRRAAVIAAAALLLALAAVPAAGIQTVPAAGTQTDEPQGPTRKVKVSTPPEYPELARKMNLHGTVRVMLTVAPDGKVSAVKELGGNPVLLSALVDAVKKWRYEPADRQSSIEVRFEFK